MKKRLPLVFFVLIFIHSLVLPVIACKMDECTAQCETEKTQCLEQLSTTLDPQKQEEIRNQCQQNYEKCIAPCAACED
jgi:hypothetical protein